MFYLYFHWHLTPQANQKRPLPDPYHDFPEVDDRVDLCRRILHRLKSKAKRLHDSSEKENGDTKSLQDCYRQVIKENFLQWFEYIPFDCEQDVTIASTKSTTSSIPEAENTQNPSTVSFNEECANAPAGSMPFLQLPFLDMILQRKRGLSTATETTTTESDTSIDETSSTSSTQQTNLSIDPDDDDLISNSSNSVGSASPEIWSIPGLHRRAMYDLVAWAFFAKDTAHLTDEEARGVDKCLLSFQDITGLVGEDEENPERCSLPCYKARRLSLEEVQGKILS